MSELLRKRDRALLRTAYNVSNDCLGRVQGTNTIEYGNDEAYFVTLQNRADASFNFDASMYVLAGEGSFRVVAVDRDGGRVLLKPDCATQYCRPGTFEDLCDVGTPLRLG